MAMFEMEKNVTNLESFNGLEEKTNVSKVKAEEVKVKKLK